MSKREYFESTRHMTAEDAHGKHSRGGKGSVEDDKTPVLVDATNRDGVHNHGRETFSGWLGQKGQMDYGLDRSTMAGTKDSERGRDPEGDCYSLDHALTGAKAVQGGDRERGGHKSTIEQP